MPAQQRVLIIEDDTSLLGKFQKFVTRAGYDVDVASRKLEALEKIRCRTYHCAMIDIMLTDDPSDRGGIECLESIVKLNEGTEALVLSATNDVRVPVEVWKKGALSYLVKKDIRSAEDVLKELKTALEKCRLNLYGPFSSFTAYLSYPEQTPFFEHALMSIFGPGISRLHSLLDRVFHRILPVVRHKGSKSSLSIDTHLNCLHGLLWSKVIGGALWLSAAGGNKEPSPPPSDCHPVEVLSEIKDFKGWHGKVVIWRVSKPRDDFSETLFEKIS